MASFTTYVEAIVKRTTLNAYEGKDIAVKNHFFNSWMAVLFTFTYYLFIHIKSFYIYSILKHKII